MMREKWQGSLYFDEEGEGCIGVLQVAYGNRQLVGERSNSMYIFGLCLPSLALSAKGWGGYILIAKLCAVNAG